MKRTRIDYTIYSPNYVPGTGECWDYPTLRGAKKKAKELGVGSLIIRNFNLNRNVPVNWWQSRLCLVWDGFIFKKSYSLSEEKWSVDISSLSQSSVLRRFRFENC
jgi:hypothetical protein